MTFVADEDKPKKTSLFDLLNLIETEKTPWNELTEEQQKAYNPYMINRFVSSKEVYTGIISQLDILKLTPEQHYTIMCEIISNARKNYFDYKAYKKENLSKNEELYLFAISKEYEIGKKEAKTYLKQMKKEVLDKLAQKWEESFKML